MMFLKGCKYKMNRGGPSTKPWGLAQDGGGGGGGAVVDVDNLFVRYDFGQRAVQVMVREDLRWERRMVWVMLMKADGKSRKIRM